MHLIHLIVHSFAKHPYRFLLRLLILALLVIAALIYLAHEGFFNLPTIPSNSGHA